MAARYWVNGGNGNWNSTTNWSNVSGGSSGSSVPSNADDVTFDANGNSNCIINVSSSAGTLTVTSGYTSTITHSAILDIWGNWTFEGTFIVAGSSDVRLRSSGTLTSNGKTWPIGITTNSSSTWTISGDLTMGGRLTIALNQTINASSSEKINLQGGLTTTSAIIGGSITLNLQGGTWNQSGGASSAINAPLTIDGNPTISGIVYLRSSITYISGTPVVTGSTLNCINVSFNINGMTLNNLESTGNGITWTLLSNITCNGTLTHNHASGGLNLASSGGTWNIYCGGLNLVSEFITSSDGTKIVLTGGSWTANTSTAQVRCNLEIAGNVNIPSAAYYITGTISGSSGTVTGTLSAGQGVSGCTFDCAGVTWTNIVFGSSLTYTVNSLLTATGTFSTTGSVTFAGTSGWTCGTFSHTGVSAFTVTLQNSVTYQITGLFDCNKSRVNSIITFTSNSGTLRANLIMPNNGSNLCNVLANFTRIDASGGRSVTTFNGTINNCVNVVQYQDYKPVAA